MFQFPFTRPAVITELLLILTKILTVTSDQEFIEAFYKSLDPGYSYGYLQTSQTEQFYPRPSLLECAIFALSSQSEFFTYHKVSHVCKNYSPKNIMTVVTSNDNNEISFYKKSKWTKVYAISIGAGSKVYDSFLNKGSPSSWNVEKCVGNFCPNFFRHPILDFWNQLSIEEVKLVIYRNQTSVVNMTFDGRSTTLANWFSYGKLKSSPWPDIFQKPVITFSIAGFLGSRRFYIASEHQGCEVDMGWLSINEAYQRCPWQISPYYPTMVFAEGNSRIIWHNGYGSGDTMAIFIRLKSN